MRWNVLLQQWKIRNDKAAIGIGAMVVFIAMVLVAGIAASVIIQTSTQLESQAMTTGQKTQDEVSKGLDVYCIEGHVHSGQKKIQRIAFMVRARAGSEEIDLSTTLIELSDGTNKYFLTYSSTQYRYKPDITGIFSSTGWTTLTADDFSIIELKDVDNSSDATNPIINRGDKVLLTVNTTATFASTSGLDNRKNIWGRIIPEQGSPGMIDFWTPSSFADTVLTLQE